MDGSGGRRDWPDDFWYCCWCVREYTAAAEALYETAQSAPFLVLTIGDVSGENATLILEVPGLLSFLSTGSFDGTVEGINDLQAQYEETYGLGNYVPYILELAHGSIMQEQDMV